MSGLTQERILQTTSPLVLNYPHLNTSNSVKHEVM